MTKFIYMESSPKLAGRARQFGKSYRRMAVVEIADDIDCPAMISERAKGVVRIVDETVASVGATSRSYGYQKRQQLQALAESMNRQQG